MSWVNVEDLEKYMSVLSQPPTDFIRERYSDVVSFTFDDIKLETTLISDEPWMELSEEPTITIDNTEKKSVLNDDLNSLATILAYQKDRVRNIPEGNTVSDYMWNGDTYIIDSPLDLSQPPSEIVLKKSDFYSVVSHTSRLIGEVLTQSDSSYRSKRRKYFDTTASLSRNIDSFYRPLGGTYLTVVLDENGTYYLLVGRRSDKVVFWPSVLTAFPAGYFKPNDISYGSVVEQHLLSEYSREAMDGGKHSNNTSKGVNAITQLLRSNNASFNITGFGIEGFTVAAELTGVFMIENPEYTDYLFKNLEESYDVSHVTAVPLENNAKSKIERMLTDEEMTPQTAFALGNGLKYLDNQTDIDIPFEISVLFEDSPSN